MQPLTNVQDCVIRQSFWWYVLPLYMILAELLGMVFDKTIIDEFVRISAIVFLYVFFFGCKRLTVKNGTLAYRSFPFHVNSVELHAIESVQVKPIRVWWSGPHLTAHLVVQKTSGGTILVPAGFLPEEKLDLLADALNKSLPRLRSARSGKRPRKRHGRRAPRSSTR